MKFLTVVAGNVEEKVEMAQEVLAAESKLKDFDLKLSEDPNKETIKWAGNGHFEKKVISQANSLKVSEISNKVTPPVSLQNNALTIKRAKDNSSKMNRLLSSIVESSSLSVTNRNSLQLPEASPWAQLRQKCGFEYLPLKVCVLGINDETTSTLERFLAEKYNLKTFRTVEQVNHLMIRANENKGALNERELSILETLFAGEPERKGG